MTEHALNHRFRRVRAQANIVSVAREQGLDMKDLSTDENILPSTQGAIDKNNIAKYFGQSTADGIQFQFRTIKKDAEALRQTANDGGDVANCLALGAGTSMAPGTPSKPTPTRSQPGSRSGKGAKRKVAVPVPSPIKRSMSDDESYDEDINYSDMDNTPSKRTKTTGRPARGSTPSRSAAVKAAATIADASAQLQNSESPADEVATPTGPVAPASIFGSVDRTSLPSFPPPSIFGNVQSKSLPSDYMSGPPSALDMMTSQLNFDPYSRSPGFDPSLDEASFMDFGDGEV
ncbi:hypothetical protein FZEAL_9991 [Fusarium zealandicum]|uniref:Uncharacterized protein n=1 Tax=Fusarium zealandicum TaxID=1053134 RepID=A0A8H4XDX2_9HYPO|nr:hypothetical protein FZEAL_9991 [Fusarium zealandicum]